MSGSIDSGTIIGFTVEFANLTLFGAIVGPTSTVRNPTGCCGLPAPSQGSCPVPGTPTGGCPELDTNSILSWTGADVPSGSFTGDMTWDPTYPRYPPGTGFGAYTVCNPSTGSCWYLWWTSSNQFVCQAVYGDGSGNFLGASSYTCNPAVIHFAFGTATGP